MLSLKFRISIDFLGPALPATLPLASKYVGSILDCLGPACSIPSRVGMKMGRLILMLSWTYLERIFMSESDQVLQRGPFSPHFPTFSAVYSALKA